jgi:photosystem II stability/assembly factor-like uncharacterized protein
MGRAAAFLLLAIFLATVSDGLHPSAPALAGSRATSPHALPLAFVEEPAPGRSYSVFGAASRVVLSPAGVQLGPDPGVVMRFVGASNDANLEGELPLPTLVHHFVGRDPEGWTRKGRVYRRVRYRGVYAGVDAVFYFSGRNIEYDLEVAPGVQPRDIVIEVEGARRIGRDAGGNLAVGTADGEIVFKRPRVYQAEAGRSIAIGGDYVLDGTNRIGFQIGPHDETRTLTIDPVIEFSQLIGASLYDQGNAIALDKLNRIYVAGHLETSRKEDAVVLRFSADGASLEYIAILGGSGYDDARGIAVDGSGRAYVTGSTQSRDFPLKAARQTALQGTAGGFVLELDANGSDLVFSTYLGGAGGDTCNAIALTSRGEACVVGRTTSYDFPTEHPLAGQGGFRPVLRSIDAGSTWTVRSDGLQSSAVRSLAVKPLDPSILYAGTQEKGVFVTADGGATWSARNSGIDTQSVNALVIDPVVPSILYAGTGAGVYKSIDAGATWVLSSQGIGSDAYVASLAIDRKNSAVLYAGTIGIVTVFGGRGGVFKSTDGGQSWKQVGYSGHIAALAIDPVDSAIVYAGYRVRGQFDSGGVYRSTDGGQTWQPPDGLMQLYSIDALAIDPTVPTTGYAGGGPMLSGLFKTTDRGATWKGLTLPGTYSPAVRAIAVDPSNNQTLYAATDNGLFKTADGGSSWTALGGGVKNADVLAVLVTQAPSTVFASTRSGSDAFATMFRPDGTLLFSTYLGGTGEDSAQGVAIDVLDAVYVTGSTKSLDLATVGPYQSQNAGGDDVWVAKIDPKQPAVLYCSYLGGSLDDHASAITVNALGEAFVTGYTYSRSFPTVSPLQATLEKAYSAFVTRFDATGGKLLYSTFLAASEGNGIAVDSSGNIHVVGRDGFVASAYATGASYAKIDSSGLKLDSLYYGFASRDDSALAVAVDSGGRAYLTGYVYSSAGHGLRDLFLLKISDVGTILDLEMSKRVYNRNDRVRIAHLRVRNSGAASRAVAVTLSFEIPGAAPATVLELGSDGSLVLPPSLDLELGPIDLFTVAADSTTGNYLFVSEMRDPATNALLSQDLAPFEIR